MSAKLGEKSEQNGYLFFKLKALFFFIKVMNLSSKCYCFYSSDLPAVLIPQS